MTRGAAAAPGPRPEEWALTLYVSGASPRSAAAIANVRRVCDGELAGRVHLEVVDVADEAARAVGDGIVAVPTLLRRRPEPVRRLVGDLEDRGRVRAGLDLPGPANVPGAPAQAEGVAARE